MVKSIPRELRAEWNKVLQLVLGWWKEAFDALGRTEQRDVAEALSLRAPRNDVRRRALKAAKAAAESVRKVHDCFACDFETVESRPCRYPRRRS
mmetsp:Transcript_8464/g.35399  ORF Transcript_8464/g.35399 Transcript_8464/m.35399 type:complete len:94 (+) Transcript_8464:361-642(+)